jgi:hypothetical protein
MFGARNCTHEPPGRLGLHVSTSTSPPYSAHSNFREESPISCGFPSLKDSLGETGLSMRPLRVLDLGERLFEFVRTVETFIFPPVGQTRDAFVKRSRLFVAGGHDEALGQIYDIRSAAAHLHDPTRFLPRTTERIRRITLLKAMHPSGISREALPGHLATAPRCIPFLRGRPDS